MSAEAEDIIISSDPNETMKADLAIITALMARLNITEAYIKPDEVPKQSRGLNIIPDAGGGYTVIILTPAIAEAYAESQGRVKS